MKVMCNWLSTGSVISDYEGRGFKLMSCTIKGDKAELVFGLYNW